MPVNHRHPRLPCGLTGLFIIEGVGVVGGVGRTHPSPRSASAFSSFTTICSGVCFENLLMAIHSARPQAARTT